MAEGPQETSVQGVQAEQAANHHGCARHPEHTHTHTHARAFSLSLSCGSPPRERERERKREEREERERKREREGAAVSHYAPSLYSLSFLRRERKRE